MSNILLDIIDLSIDYERERDDMTTTEDLHAIAQRLKEHRTNLLEAAKLYIQLQE